MFGRLMKKIITVFAIVIAATIFCCMLIVPSCDKETPKAFLLLF